MASKSTEHYDPTEFKRREALYAATDPHASPLVDPPRALPVLALKNCPALPGMTMPVDVSRVSALAMLDHLVWEGLREIAVVMQTDPRIETPGPAEVHVVGCRARVLTITGNGPRHMVLQGHERVRLLGFSQSTPFLMANVEACEVLPPSVEQITLSHEIFALVERLAADHRIPRGALEVVRPWRDDPAALADLVAQMGNPTEQQRVLEAQDLTLRCRIVLEIVQRAWPASRPVEAPVPQGAMPQGPAYLADAVSRKTRAGAAVRSAMSVVPKRLVPKALKARANDQPRAELLLDEVLAVAIAAEDAGKEAAIPQSYWMHLAEAADNLDDVLLGTFAMGKALGMSRRSELDRYAAAVVLRYALPPGIFADEPRLSATLEQLVAALSALVAEASGRWANASLEEIALDLGEHLGTKKTAHRLESDYPEAFWSELAEWLASVAELRQGPLAMCTWSLVDVTVRRAHRRR